MSLLLFVVQVSQMRVEVVDMPVGVDKSGNRNGKRLSVTPVHLLDDGSNSGKPGRHVQVHLLMSFRIQGIQHREDGKDCSLPPSSVGEGGEVGVPRNLFPRLGRVG